MRGSEGKSEKTFRPFIALLVALLFGFAAADSSAAVHWTFEGTAGPALDDWRQTADPQQAGPGLAVRGPDDAVRINTEGRVALSSFESAAPGVEDSGLRGVWESPQFTLRSPFASLLVRGAGSGVGSDAFFAVCRPNPVAPRGCDEQLRLNAPAASRTFRYRTLDLSRHTGGRVFLQLVDESPAAGIAIDDFRANAPLMPSDLVARPTAKGPSLAWIPAADASRVASYSIFRSSFPGGRLLRVKTVNCRTGRCPSAYLDRSAPRGRSLRYRLIATDRQGNESEGNVAYASPWASPNSRGPAVWRQGANLTAISFPVGGNGTSGVLHLGDGRRNEGLIFNAYGQYHDRTQYMVPNSFFAVRASRRGGKPAVRALQTTPEGPFRGMESLQFNGEYPFARYRFRDSRLPVRVTETVYSPTIPGDMKNSAIPVAIYDFRLHNPGSGPVAVSLLASQQNAAGFDGQSEVGGVDRRDHPSYGSNLNRLVKGDGKSRLELTGNSGSMVLSMPGAAVAGTASWATEKALHDTFRATGAVTGPDEAGSPGPGVTVDGALVRRVTVPPRGHRSVRVVLSWNFPTRHRIFGGDGVQYSNWWGDANEVDRYVFANLNRLSRQTRRFHDFMYGSDLPRFVLDRLTGNIATLRSPSMFWAKNGFFGGWEGWSCCWNMPTHVWQYAQTQARLWPEIGRRFESQWLSGIDPDGLIPYRYGVHEYAVDGQLGVILATYRDYLSSPNDSWLTGLWPRVERAMEYVISQSDPDRDGVTGGQALTTLDFLQTVDNPWIGSLYLAALNAAERMAQIAGDPSRAGEYRGLRLAGRTAQQERYWRTGYFSGVADPNPIVYSQANGLDIDMLLGEWWASQLGLEPVYDPVRMKQALARLYRENYRPQLTGANPYDSYQLDTYSPNLGSRVFADVNDAGTVATTWPEGGDPKAKPFYWKEMWSGREYAAAATMIGQGSVRQGLDLVKAVNDRYDGRLRNGPFMAVGPPGTWLETCHTGEGTGNPFGDDECGNWYGRALSGWSLLLALQGFSYDGPAGVLGFAPTYRPDSHRSFFTAGNAWGQFSQRRQGRRFTASIRLGRGPLALRRLELSRVSRSVRGRATVHLNGRKLRVAEATTRKGRVAVRFGGGVKLRAGSNLSIRIG